MTRAEYQRAIYGGRADFPGRAEPIVRPAPITRVRFATPRPPGTNVDLERQHFTNVVNGRARRRSSQSHSQKPRLAR
jgi:hypothetical protein